ncbi:MULTISPECIES: hypothetical protein [Mumia]|uniref:hypothetical protein n=1 Tax=Mumia TaxID=1546255 RepID=UPI00142396AD|nr:hypothetical protein [Mumia sp. ZJ430]
MEGFGGGLVLMQRDDWPAFVDRMFAESRDEVDTVVSHTQNQSVGLRSESLMRVHFAQSQRCLVLPYPIGRDGDGREILTLFVGLSPMRAGALGSDVLSAARLPRERLSGQFGQPIGPTSQVIDLLGPPIAVLERWWSVELPSVVIFVSAETTEDTVVRLVEKAVPAAARPVVPILVVPERVRDAVTCVLGAYGLALPRAGGAVVARTAHEHRAREIATHFPLREDPRRLARVIACAVVELGTEVQMALATNAADKLRNLLADEDDPEELALRREIERQTSRADRLDNELHTARRRIRQLETLVARTEQQKAAPAAHVGPPAAAPVSREPEAAPRVPPPPPPEFATFADLLAAARRTLKHVDLADDLEVRAAAIDEHAKSPRWRQRSWEALTLLEEYAAAKAGGTATAPSLRAYVEDHPRPTISPKHVAAGESQLIKDTPHFREPRTFTLPREVAPSGKAFFGPHIRIQLGGGRPTPRLYFYDDTSGPTRRVYVGHLGDHLRTRRT